MDAVDEYGEGPPSPYIEASLRRRGVAPAGDTERVPPLPTLKR